MFRLERTVTRRGQTTTEVVYGIISPSPAAVSAEPLLTYIRQHWHIESKSHWVQDVTFDEDPSQVRQGHLPHVMAALRNAVIGLLGAAHFKPTFRTLKQVHMNLIFEKISHSFKIKQQKIMKN